MGVAIAAAVPGIGLEGIRKMADEQVADVREGSGAAGGNFSRSEQTIKALQRIMDAAVLRKRRAWSVSNNSKSSLDAWVRMCWRQ